MTKHSYYDFFFFFNDTATTEIYTLSLHDALPICRLENAVGPRRPDRHHERTVPEDLGRRHHGSRPRSEEHTSELQSRLHLVCRLLLEKKKIQRFRRRRSHSHASINSSTLDSIRAS